MWSLPKLRICYKLKASLQFSLLSFNSQLENTSLQQQCELSQNTCVTLEVR